MSTHTQGVIQTMYRGYRFRSRLEARWAVFFDSAGIRFNYEPQGYVVNGVPYLPDFWLHGLDMWAEVKGICRDEDMDVLIDAAVALPTQIGTDVYPDPIRPKTWGSNSGRIALLGNIPNGESGCVMLHSVLRYTAGAVSLGRAFFETRRTGAVCEMVGLGPTIVVALSNKRTLRKRMSGSDTCRLLDAIEMNRLEPRAEVSDAYRAARAARFEHGETP